MRAGQLSRAVWFELLIFAVVTVLPFLPPPAQLVLTVAAWVTALARVLWRACEGRCGQS